MEIKSNHTVPTPDRPSELRPVPRMSCIGENPQFWHRRSVTRCPLHSLHFKVSCLLMHGILYSCSNPICQ